MAGSPSEGKQVQNTNSNTSSTNTAGPNPAIAGKLDNLLGNAWDWMGQNMNAPAYYPGATVAAPSAAQQSARDTTWNFASNGLNSLGPQFAPTLGYLNDAAGGKYLDLKSNPYYQAAMAASLKPGTENFQNNIIPGLQAQFAGSGRPGAGLNNQKVEQATLDFSRATQDALATAGNQAYATERGLQSTAAGMLPGALGNMSSLGSGYLGLLNGIGASDTAYNQRLTDADMAKWNYDQTAQLDWYTRLSQALQAMYPGGETVGSGTSSGTTTGTSTQSGGGGGAGSIIGPAIGAIGSVAAMY